MARILNNPEMVSSEESCGEDDDGTKIFFVKVHPWHSAKYRSRLKKVDKKAVELETLSSKRMRWRRKPGAVKTDSEPPESLKDEDLWVIVEGWYNDVPNDGTDGGSNDGGSNDGSND